MKYLRILLILVAAFALAAAPQAQKAAKKAGTAAAQTAKTTAAGGLIDINTAGEKELKELPGIGDAYAAKIVSNRPYARKDDLVRKKVIPQATYDKIKDRIIARQRK